MPNRATIDFRPDERLTGPLLEDLRAVFARHGYIAAVDARGHLQWRPKEPPRTAPRPANTWPEGRTRGARA